ncbi:MAG: hypothetical protein RLZZ323_621 [Bacteroidota bacterium]|jgi:hypothetical protein
MKKYTIENLLKIDTLVSEYFKENEELNRELAINEITLETLKTIFINEPNDEELFLCYPVNELQAEMINKSLKTKIDFNFTEFEYYLERYGEYK